MIAISWNGTESLASGVYTFETLNANGCESIATLALTSNSSSASTAEVTECASYSWHGTEYLTSGVYTFETLNANGCASIATLDLTINASSASTAEVLRNVMSYIVEQPDLHRRVEHTPSKVPTQRVVIARLH